MMNCLVGMLQPFVLRGCQVSVKVVPHWESDDLPQTLQLIDRYNSETCRLYRRSDGNADPSWPRFARHSHRYRDPSRISVPQRLQQWPPDVISGWTNPPRPVSGPVRPRVHYSRFLIAFNLYLQSEDIT